MSRLVAELWGCSFVYRNQSVPPAGGAVHGGTQSVLPAGGALGVFVYISHSECPACRRSSGGVRL